MGGGDISCSVCTLRCHPHPISIPLSFIFISSSTYKNVQINKSLVQFAHWANKEQIAKRKEQLKHLSYRRRPVSIVFCGLCHLCYETIDPDLRRGDDFIFFFHKLLFIEVLYIPPLITNHLH